MLAETMCSAVSAAGLGIAAVTAYRRRFLTAARITAYALVPVGLVLTGVVQWVSGLVFEPAVWAGFGLLALAWLILAGARAVERRRVGRATGASAAGDAVAPAASAPSLGAGARTRPAARQEPSAAAPGEDFSDIEAILKKHGI
ncbi:hypothetical protein AMK16_28720 [Streptomyces sp. CB00455]|uniref:hypothetical protein n=1 Tax=Streptomyces sp. CB00455 TaxID=1703927 RepID=UPI00093BC04F|nr:hypothetical protein [Streptomyces sp. CB00455]OKK15216.1 hypothetical protein AMK16_28720 [Streptomyces sp. CB00455]